MHPAFTWPSCLLIAGLTGVFVLGGDALAVHAIDRHVPASVQAYFSWMSYLADATVLSLCAAAAYLTSRFVPIGLPVMPRACCQVRHGSALMLLTLSTGGVVIFSLKQLIARARPRLLLDAGHYGTAEAFRGGPFDSFPSSHAFTAFAAAAVLGHVLPRWRWPLAALSAYLAVCRILALAHFPSDVLASAVIAVGCTHFWASRLPLHPASFKP